MSSKYSQCLAGCEKEKTFSDSIGSFSGTVGQLVIKIAIIYAIIVATSFGLFSWLPLVRKPSSFITGM